MGYDNGYTVTYTSTVVQDIGAGVGTAWSFKGPKGKKGRLIDVGIRGITEAFTNDTTGAKINVGTTGDADAYASLDCAQAAITDTFNTVDDTDAIISAQLPADTQIEVTHVAPTGGTPAGIGWPYVVVVWY